MEAAEIVSMVREICIANQVDSPIIESRMASAIVLVARVMMVGPAVEWQSNEHPLRDRGLELADSVTIDPHKWFYAPLAAMLGGEKVAVAPSGKPPEERHEPISFSLPQERHEPAHADSL